jgi:Ca2+-binding EF-hand superfamily protein
MARPGHYKPPDATVFRPEDRENYKNAFDTFDDDRDDLVATDLIGKLIRAIGYNPLPEEVEDMQRDIGRDTFNFNTFLYIIYRHAREADPEAELIEALRVFDKKGTGKLPEAQIRKILANLKQPFTERQIGELLGRAEIDSSGQVDYAEFAKLMLDF